MQTSAWLHYRPWPSLDLRPDTVFWSHPQTPLPHHFYPCHRPGQSQPQAHGNHLFHLLTKTRTRNGTGIGFRTVGSSGSIRSRSSSRIRSSANPRGCRCIKRWTGSYFKFPSELLGRDAGHGIPTSCTWCFCIIFSGNFRRRSIIRRLWFRNPTTNQSCSSN